MKRLRSVVAACLLLAACGGDNTGPSNVNVTGTWSASLTNFSGSGASCNATGITLQLSQSGTSFAGTYAGGTFVCSGPGGSGQFAGSSGIIINGTVSGSAVSFNVDTPDSHFSGTVSGNSMSGQGTERIDFGAPTGVVTLSGSWGAAKQ